MKEILQEITQKLIKLPLRGRPVLLITRIITDRIGFHSVLLPLRNISFAL